MQKMACVFSYKMSSWVSCQKIVFNLHKAYQLNSDLELLNFNYSSEQTVRDINITAQNIFNARPDVIVILDHKPHPLPLLQILTNLYRNEKKPRIIFHVFGDFTLYYPQWENLESSLKGFRVDFITASERQKHLIDKFLPSSMSCSVCPFPVDKNEFSYVPKLRKTQRDQWGLSESDLAFVFTGRLSRQKRIHTLLKSFNEAVTISGNQNAHLFLYGGTDNVGDSFVGKWEVEGEYFRKIHRLYKSLPESIQSRIHFMGNVPNSELKSVYQAADFLVNLSVHNDEDFGMSVAEAQCSGLPAILTDWGGLAGFQHSEMPKATYFIPVKIGRSNKIMDYAKVVSDLVHAFNAKAIDRNAFSTLALSKLGIEKASHILENVLKKSPSPFEGFSPFLKEVTTKTRFNPLPYLAENRTINNLYRKIYSSYVRHH